MDANENNLQSHAIAIYPKVLLARDAGSRRRHSEIRVYSRFLTCINTA
jgi:hypothetical protein